MNHALRRALARLALQQAPRPELAGWAAAPPAAQLTSLLPLQRAGFASSKRPPAGGDAEGGAADARLLGRGEEQREKARRSESAGGVGVLAL